MNLFITRTIFLVAGIAVGLGVAHRDPKSEIADDAMAGPKLAVMCDDRGHYIFTGYTGHPVHSSYTDFESAKDALDQYQLSGGHLSGPLVICGGPEPSPTETPITLRLEKTTNRVLKFPAWDSGVVSEIGFLVSASDSLMITDVPILSVTMSCGSRWELCPGDAIPTANVPCSCGNPKHWFFKVDQK